MKKYFYSIVVLLCLQTTVATYGQANPNTLYKVTIGEIAYANKEKASSVGSVLGTIADVLVTGKATKQQDQYADAVRASIVKGIGNVKRFRAIEEPLFQNETNADEPALYVDGIVNNIATTSKTEPSAVKNKPATQYYKGVVGVTLNLKDAHTGEVVCSRTFNLTDTDCSWVSTAENAINELLANLSVKITRYYNSIYPLRASVVERGEVKKNKQKEIYIDLGDDYNAYEGQHFDVYSVKTIAGKKAQIELGRTKIIKVMGRDLSLCKVTRGEEKIKAALDEKENIIVVSRD